MKKTLIYFTLAFVVMATSCKKDNNNGEDPLHGFRLTQLEWVEDGIVDETIFFSYEGDKVSGWMNGDEGNAENKADANYPDDNTAEFISYEKDDDVWTKDFKMEYTFNDGRVVLLQDYNFDGNEFVLSYKTTFQYNGNGDIVESVDSQFPEGNETLSHKQTFSYDGVKRVESLRYHYHEGSWVANSKLAHQYENDRLISSIFSYFSNNIWNQYYKDEFKYEENRVSAIDGYEFSDGTTWTLDCTTTFFYDSDGNMTKAEDVSSDGNIYIENFVYEQKPGNLSIFGFEDNYGYPNPIYNPAPQLPFAKDWRGQGRKQ